MHLNLHLHILLNLHLHQVLEEAAASASLHRVVELVGDMASLYSRYYNRSFLWWWL